MPRPPENGVVHRKSLSNNFESYDSPPVSHKLSNDTPKTKLNESIGLSIV